MSKTGRAPLFVVDMRHDYTAEPQYAVSVSWERAVERAHEFFLSYDFEVRNGKQYDSGNDPDGASVFDNVTMEGEKVAGFMHCGGEGPYCRIEKAEALDV